MNTTIEGSEVQTSAGVSTDNAAGTNEKVGEKQTPQVVAPSKEHAAALKNAYTAVVASDKVAAKADKAFNDFVAIGNNCLNGEQVANLIDRAVDDYRTSLIQRAASRKVVQSLPAGTTAPGGANRQTVVVGLFGRVDERLGKVMDRTDANKVNRASFG